MTKGRTLPGDWYHGTVPATVVIDDTASVESAFSFHVYRSRHPGGVTIGRGASTYAGTLFDVGREGRVVVGDYVMVNGAHIICDAEVTIGAYTLISWNVVLMDSYRPHAVRSRRQGELRKVPHRVRRRALSVGPARPIHIGRNVWIGFEACVLPGVTIGDGSVVGARSVVATDVPPYTIVAGNPARPIRRLPRPGAA